MRPPLATLWRETVESGLLTSNFHSVNQTVSVRLKWAETEYKGRLVSIDSYMNLQLSGAEEYIDRKMTGALGEVLIRLVQKTSWGGVVPAC